jgi:hypothetical protein
MSKKRLLFEQASLKPKGRFVNGRPQRGKDQVVQQLLDDGYEVLTKGWPDILAIRGDTVRMIEVKSPHACGLSRGQQRMHEILKGLGFKVEIVVVSNFLPQKPL